MFYNEKIFKRCFDYRGRYWYKNIKYIPLYFKLMRHLIKHGYDEYANWETFDWFIYTMKDILVTYRNNHNGYPYVSFDDKVQEQAEKKYDEDLDTMIALLDDMDEGNPKYNSMKYADVNKTMDSAKDEFFELFSKYFYHLWD